MGNQQYELTDSTLIDLSIKNISSSPIYYNTCDSRTIEEVENRKITESIIFTNPCMCTCVITIHPNEQTELNIIGYFITQHSGKLKLTESISYKILPHFYKDKAQKKQISLVLSIQRRSHSLITKISI